MMKLNQSELNHIVGGADTPDLVNEPPVTVTFGEHGAVQIHGEVGGNGRVRIFDIFIRQRVPAPDIP